MVRTPPRHRVCLEVSVREVAGPHSSSSSSVLAPPCFADGPYALDITPDGNLNVRLMSGEKVFSQPFIRNARLFPQAASVDPAVLRECRRKLYKAENDRPVLLVADVMTMEGQVLLEHLYLPMIEEAWSRTANIHVVCLCPSRETPPHRRGPPLRFVGAVHSIGFALAGSLLPSKHTSGMSLAGSPLAETKVAFVPREAFTSVEDMCRHC